MIQRAVFAVGLSASTRQPQHLGVGRRRRRIGDNHQPIQPSTRRKITWHKSPPSARLISAQPEAAQQPNTRRPPASSAAAGNGPAVQAAGRSPQSGFTDHSMRPSRRHPPASAMTIRHSARYRHASASPDRESRSTGDIEGHAANAGRQSLSSRLLRGMPET